MLNFLDDIANFLGVFSEVLGLTLQKVTKLFLEKIDVKPINFRNCMIFGYFSTKISNFNQICRWHPETFPIFWLKRRECIGYRLLLSFSMLSKTCIYDVIWVSIHLVGTVRKGFSLAGAFSFLRFFVKFHKLWAIKWRNMERHAWNNIFWNKGHFSSYLFVSALLFVKTSEIRCSIMAWTKKTWLAY